ncbi:hypothetical protein S140_103 [Shewanella sp. phage 1/40]|uniref:hypothetical protein n=1 Tax=Shewanella sp. phage 1/40 TaxID=1458860 RepID=UPI0004F59FF6|nr:hypothetical protein S140_103 [Shewanella sp. phage 1/40]AHK11510.1 hypothetical protein S140_103 [Shewanella sp. phage 1/40]
MTQYKIQIGSWTKLPYGQVQEDTRDIMGMMADKCLSDVERHNAKVGASWSYIGVDRDHTVRVYQNAGDYLGLKNEPSLFIPYEELQKMLNVPKEQHVSSLLNTKLDCRKPDGTVDEELSRAFQEACFEQGIVWRGGDTGISYLNKPFLYTGEEGLENGTMSSTFERAKEKQINFNYSRTLTWEATEVEPAEEMVDICGVEYSAKELNAALELIKKSRKE